MSGFNAMVDSRRGGIVGLSGTWKIPKEDLGMRGDVGRWSSAHSSPLTS